MSSACAGLSFLRRPWAHGCSAVPTWLPTRWAVALNLEGTKTLYKSIALAAFADAGIVDPRAIPPVPASQSYTTLYDGGVGVVTRHRINDLSWTMRFELPLVVNRWDYAADGNAFSDGRLHFRWQVSLEPTF